MKKISLIILVLILLARVDAKELTSKELIIEHKIDSLLKLMTLSEKIGQMNQLSGEGEKTGPVNETQNYIDEIKKANIGSILNANGVEYTRKLQKLAVENSRLHIPLIFGYDVIHGYKTIMPLPLAEACSWDLEAIEKSARIAAIEASAAGQHWTFAPMVDIMRDCRWGRVMEGSGEDPFLGSAIAKVRVRGFQGKNLSEKTSIVACAKHYAGYGFGEAGRDYNTVDINDNTLNNVVLIPFKACADEGIGTFMNSFNEMGGVPAAGNPHLLRGILKGDWNFDGFVVSDWSSIMEMTHHGFAKDLKDAALKASIAGCDMDMESRAYIPYLEQLVKEGKVNENIINDAVRRILRIKYRLGLFENPYKNCDEKLEKDVLLCKSHLDFSAEIAKKSIVLLKNDNSLLPINKNVGKIAVIGSFANDKDSPLGNWRGQGIKNSAVSVLEGLKNVYGKRVEFAEGYKLSENDIKTCNNTRLPNQQEKEMFDKAILLAKSSEVVIFAIGEYANQSGEAHSVVDITPKGLQLRLLSEVLAVNKNVVVLVMSGRPLDLSQVVNAPAVLQTWHLGSQAGIAITDVLSGNYNPSGKLTMSFPRCVGQLPIYYNHKNTGRPVPEQNKNEAYKSNYDDVDNSPLFSFGFGLSYTKFEYSPISLNKSEITTDGLLEVKVMVNNAGSIDGEEVVQLYIRDLVASITRPVKELKGFKKIFLKSGESKDVTFVLNAKDLAFYNAEKKFVVEPGEFKVFVGGNSDDVKVAGFEVK